MPSKDSHPRIIHENTAAINWVRQAQPPMPQWVVTIAFYKALHIIEAATDTYSGFADYMPLLEVEKKHLNHSLVQIVRTARTLMGDPTFLQDEYP